MIQCIMSACFCALERRRSASLRAARPRASRCSLTALPLRARSASALSHTNTSSLRPLVAGNFVTPLALLQLQTTGGGGGAWRLEHPAFAALERALDFGWTYNEYATFSVAAVVVLWGVLTPILRSRACHKAKVA